MISLDEFKKFHHAISLLGMSGVGKTVLSKSLRQSGNWYHYSADYRIGTRYLAEHILDNIKFKIMQMNDPFVADLLRSDSIYINHNITVDNLTPVSTYLGMYGDPQNGGLTKQTFLNRQNDYRRAETRSMQDTERFIDKAWQIYGCRNFVNDASGSLCEIIDLDHPSDPVISKLIPKTLILYIQADIEYEKQLKARAHSHPKPLFYNPAFLSRYLENKPDNGAGVDPLDFARPLFPDLLNFRKPRYAMIAERHGFIIPANDLFESNAFEETVPTSVSFLSRLHTAVCTQASESEAAAKKLEAYISACRSRADSRY
tara:strand:+ start:118 stop:1062 length:945 start_codon:yes stop_codon:yes gene_type:complete